ncbi:MAG: tyrosine--tRNA ligase [Armatimonadota bacterium]
MVPVEQQLATLMRGVAHFIPEEELKIKLDKSISTGKPLRVKLGLDPTAPDIHLGFAVVLRKLRQFQDYGHTACLVIGDFTAMIGDPTGKSKTRPQLSREQVLEHAKTYQNQLFRILDQAKTEITFNGDWLGKMDFASVIQLASRTTVARILERDDFTKRLEENRPLGLHEILYPLCQGYDSVAIHSDIEMGGTDQMFNNLVGRDLQREYGQEPQSVLAMPLLVGLDGTEKMSKSLGNYIGIDEEPQQQYGKVMSIPDHAIGMYYELCTDVPMDEVAVMLAAMADGSLNPMVAKRRLGREIVSIYHGKEAGDAAEAEFTRIFSKKEIPQDMPEMCIPADIIADGKVWLPKLLHGLGLVKSNGEARRMIQQGGVSINDQKMTDEKAELDVAALTGAVIRVGKLRFTRVR